jgi:hypothetical protein
MTLKSMCGFIYERNNRKCYIDSYIKEITENGKMCNKLIIAVSGEVQGDLNYN